MILNKEQLLKIDGGAFTAAYLTSIVRGVTFLIDLGRSLGSAIRRLQTRTLC